MNGNASYPDLLPEGEGTVAQLNLLLPALPLLAGEGWGEGSAEFWLHLMDALAATSAGKLETLLPPLAATRAAVKTAALNPERIAA